MTFNLRQLDNLSYDAVEPILYDYIQGAIDTFVTSLEGEAHLQTYPDGGSWIGNFIELSYNYGETTLPQMTKGDVQNLMEYTLPRKVTVFDPAEAEDAIPELVAFWRFLQREYKLRNAGAIVKYLESLAPKFPAMMSDPARGGIAKAFLMMGQQSGFNMTTPEGVEAFQQQYNVNPQSSNADWITNAMNSMMAGAVPLPSSSQPTSSRPKPKGMGTQKPNSSKKTDRKKTNRKKK